LRRSPFGLVSKTLGLVFRQSENFALGYEPFLLNLCVLNNLHRLHVCRLNQPRRLALCCH
jgi:hypothetical protein